MKLPTCTVPTKSSWEKLRQTAGGKAGLSKTSLSKALETFHAALSKANTSGDLANANLAISALSKAAKAYLEDVKKTGKYHELESTISREVIGKLNAFVKAMEEAAKTANAEINKIELAVEHEVKNRIEMVKRGTTECDNRVNPMNEEFQKLAEKYKLGVPKNDAGPLKRLVEEGAKHLAEYKKAIQELDKALVEVVTNNIQKHREILDKLNTELGNAKGQIKATNEAINQGLARTKELSIVLQKQI
jgi:flagellar biosynthesis chaperone FliJ